MMLLIHLSFLVFTSFMPGDSMAVSFRKECLREKNKATTVSANQNYPPFYVSLFDAADEEHKAVIKVCSVKLFCTAASEAVTSLNPPQISKAVSFYFKAYHSIAITGDPDPPRYC
jgi:hypothetical protein